MAGTLWHHAAISLSVFQNEPVKSPHFPKKSGGPFNATTEDPIVNGHCPVENTGVEPVAFPTNGRDALAPCCHFPFSIPK